jgi:hypothetical protein
MQLFQALLVHVIEVLYCMHLAQLRVVCLNKVRGLGEMDRRLVGGEEGGRAALVTKNETAFRVSGGDWTRGGGENLKALRDVRSLRAVEHSRSVRTTLGGEEYRDNGVLNPPVIAIYLEAERSKACVSRLRYAHALDLFGTRFRGKGLMQHEQPAVETPSHLQMIHLG